MKFTQPCNSIELYIYLKTAGKNFGLCKTAYKTRHIKNIYEYYFEPCVMGFARVDPGFSIWGRGGGGRGTNECQSELSRRVWGNDPQKFFETLSL